MVPKRKEKKKSKKEEKNKKDSWAVVAHALVPALGRQRRAALLGQPGLQSEFQDSQGYREKPCHKKNRECVCVSACVFPLSK